MRTTVVQTISLPPDLSAKLTAWSKATRTPKSALLARLIRDHAPEFKPKPYKPQIQLV